jgi:hypothetical protein
MTFMSEITLPHQPPMSILVLSDRLLTLAKDADHVGMRVAAEHLLYLAHYVLEQPAEN